MRCLICCMCRVSALKYDDADITTDLLRANICHTVWLRVLITTSSKDHMLMYVITKLPEIWIPLECTISHVCCRNVIEMSLEFSM